MIHTNRGQRIDTIFILIIFCVFAISVLMALMFSAGVYKNVIEMTNDGFTDNSILSYIWTKVKNSDEAGRIYVGEFEGLPTLYFEEEFGGIKYRTAVYQYDGWVCELFCEADLDFHPDNGAQIIKLDNLTFSELEEGLIKVSSGGRNLLLFPRARGR